MHDEEEDIGTGTHVEDSRIDPTEYEDDADKSVVDRLKDVFTDDDNEVDDEHKAM